MPGARALRVQVRAGCTPSPWASLAAASLHAFTDTHGCAAQRQLAHPWSPPPHPFPTHPPCIPPPSHTPKKNTKTARRQFVFLLQEAMSVFERCPVPVVAAIHGHCVGAGAAVLHVASCGREPGCKQNMRARGWRLGACCLGLPGGAPPPAACPPQTRLHAPCPAAPSFGRGGPGHSLRHPAGHTRRADLREGAAVCVCVGWGKAP